MMVWPGERTRQRWLTHFARERKNLSVSVEETLAAHTTQSSRYVDELEDYEDHTDEDERQDARKRGLIPPRLSLQSRSMPAVQLPGSQTQLVRPANGDVLPTTTPVEVPQEEGQKKPQLAGKSTRVRLQAVRPLQVSGSYPVIEHERSREYEERQQSKAGENGARGWDGKHGASGRDDKANARYTIQSERLVVVKNVVGDRMAIENQRTSALVPVTPEAGSGVFEQGQSSLSIASEVISAQSVVMVTLTGNPGPVVVQYISLQPGIGFTIHLSASTTGMTPFNYVIWPSRAS